MIYIIFYFLGAVATGTFLDLNFTYFNLFDKLGIMNSLDYIDHDYGEYWAITLLWPITVPIICIIGFLYFSITLPYKVISHFLDKRS